MGKQEKPWIRFELNEDHIGIKHFLTIERNLQITSPECTIEKQD